MIFSFQSEPLDIEILMLEGSNLIQIACIIEPLRVANRVLGRQLYSWSISSLDGKPVETTSGIVLPVDYCFAADRTTAPLLVVASYNHAKFRKKSLLHSLSQARRFRTVIGGIENGVWLLAEAGLLNDGRASVHWEEADAFALAYPHIDIVNQGFVIDETRVSAAGSLPTLNMILEWIRLRNGFAIAMAISRQFIHSADNALSEVVKQPGFGHSFAGDDRLAEVLNTMEQALATPVSIKKLAGESGISARRLQMLFAKHLLVSPKRYYLALRLNAARRLLIETAQSATEIAEATGFSGSAGFSASYRKAYGETPTQTRQAQMP